jgi:hypothetical protein
LSPLRRSAASFSRNIREFATQLPTQVGVNENRRDSLKVFRRVAEEPVAVRGHEAAFAGYVERVEGHPVGIGRIHSHQGGVSEGIQVSGIQLPFGLCRHLIRQLLSQGSAGTVEAATHGTDGDIQQERGLLVVVTLEVMQADGLPLLGSQPGQRIGDGIPNRVMSQGLWRRALAGPPPILS